VVGGILGFGGDSQLVVLFYTILENFLTLFSQFFVCAASKVLCCGILRAMSQDFRHMEMIMFIWLSSAAMDGLVSGAVHSMKRWASSSRLVMAAGSVEWRAEEEMRASVAASSSRRWGRGSRRKRSRSFSLVSLFMADDFCDLIENRKDVRRRTGRDFILPGVNVMREVFEIGVV